MSRREWLQTFADPAVLSDLLAAARSCMAEIDDCDPEECAHPEQLVAPVEFVHWIEREVMRSERGAGVRRIDHHEHMSRKAIARHARSRGLECATG